MKDPAEREMRMEETADIDTKIFEQLIEVATLRGGFRAVKKNKGSAGIDGVSIEAYESELDKELAVLSNELKNWTYRPQPVRRVEIAKADGGVRTLGVACVRDRVVQASLQRLLDPLLDPGFSESSFGFRPGRGQQRAVEKAHEEVKAGKEYIVDIDLEKFFDRIHHDRLIGRLGQSIKDKRILRLIGEILRSGIMADGLVSVSDQGVPQGSPLSPLLSNVVLDELDKELEKRGLAFARFADDCNIFVASSKAAERVMVSISEFIEKKLRLTVNKVKSKVARSEFVKFLGMTVIAGTLMISQKSYARAFERVRELVPTRRSHLTLTERIKKINRWYTGWSNYYQMTQYPSQLRAIEAHIRRRLRASLVDNAKGRRGILHHQLVRRGTSPALARKAAFSNRGRWALSGTMGVSRAYPNIYFIQQLGLKVRSDKGLAHWHDIEVVRKFP